MGAAGSSYRVWAAGGGLLCGVIGAAQAGLALLELGSDSRNVNVPLGLALFGLGLALLAVGLGALVSSYLPYRRATRTIELAGLGVSAFDTALIVASSGTGEFSSFVWAAVPAGCALALARAAHAARRRS